MATITETHTILTDFESGSYTVVTPTVSVSFDSLEKAREWAPLISTRIVSKREAQSHSIQNIKSLKISNPEYFKK